MQHTLRAHNLVFLIPFVLLLSPKIIIKMFHQFPPTNNRRRYFDWQTNLHLLANVSIGRDSVMLFVMSSCLLVMSSCRLCMVLSCLPVMLCFRHILLKKAGLDSGLWTLDSGPPHQTKKCCKKILLITLPRYLLKFCRKRNRNNVFVVEHVWAWGT